MAITAGAVVANKNGVKFTVLRVVYGDVVLLGRDGIVRTLALATVENSFAVCK